MDGWNAGPYRVRAGWFEWRLTSSTLKTDQQCIEWRFGAKGFIPTTVHVLCDSLQSVLMKEQCACQYTWRPLSTVQCTQLSTCASMQLACINTYDLTAPAGKTQQRCSF
eukprot:1157892-Pelagomonas_calceolata.AAC.9